MLFFFCKGCKSGVFRDKTWNLCQTCLPHAQVACASHSEYVARGYRVEAERRLHQHEPERPDIGAEGVAVAREALRRYVGLGADPLGGVTGAAELQGAKAGTDPQGVNPHLAGLGGDAEVAQLRPPAGREKDITGLDVAMDHLQLVVQELGAQYIHGDGRECRGRHRVRRV